MSIDNSCMKSKINQRKQRPKRPKKSVINKIKNKRIKKNVDHIVQNIHNSKLTDNKIVNEIPPFWYDDSNFKIFEQFLLDHSKYINHDLLSTNQDGTLNIPEHMKILNGVISSLKMANFPVDKLNKLVINHDKMRDDSQKAHDLKVKVKKVPKLKEEKENQNIINSHQYRIKFTHGQTEILSEYFDKYEKLYNLLVDIWIKYDDMPDELFTVRKVVYKWFRYKYAELYENYETNIDKIVKELQLVGKERSDEKVSIGEIIKIEQSKLDERYKTDLKIWKEKNADQLKNDLEYDTDKPEMKKFKYVNPKTEYIEKTRKRVKEIETIMAEKYKKIKETNPEHEHEYTKSKTAKKTKNKFIGSILELPISYFGLVDELDVILLTKLLEYNKALNEHNRKLKDDQNYKGRKPQKEDDYIFPEFNQNYEDLKDDGEKFPPYDSLDETINIFSSKESSERQ